MKAFLDTSVLIQAFYSHYPYHLPSIELFKRYDKFEASCATHNLAETYANLTGLPGRDRMGRDEALLYIENIRERLTIVALNEQEYGDALHFAASLGITGGGIYDALIARCALKVGAEIIYTWNVKHFTRRLGPEIAIRVRTP